MTADGQIRVGQTFRLAIVTVGGADVYLRPVLFGDDIFSAGGVFNTWAITEQVTAYVEPGEEIRVRAFRNTVSVGDSNAHFELTGILAD